LIISKCITCSVTSLQLELSIIKNQQRELFNMKNITSFLKTTLAGGILVVFPLLLFYLLLAEMMELVVALATPMADLFPLGTFEKINADILMAVILIVGVSFIFGLTLRSNSLKRFGLWIEHSTLAHLPMYRAVKNLARGLVGAEDGNIFHPAVLNSPDGSKEIVYVIEDHGNGYLTILIPWAPASFAGSVKIMKRDRVELLSASFGEASMVLSHWGLGADNLLKKAKTENDSEQNKI